MELITEPLSPERIEAELPQIIAWLKERGIDELCVVYGVGSNVPLDEQWKPIPISTNELSAFIHGARTSGAFVFGASDLYIHNRWAIIRDTESTFHLSDAMPRLVFRFCHESDIHVESDDPQFIERVKLNWIGKGTHGYESSDTPRQWVRFG